MQTQPIKKYFAKEYKIISLRDCPLPDSLVVCDTPDQAFKYWNDQITKHPAFNPDVENFVILILNARKRIRGHHYVASGTLDSVHTHPREVFRLAIIDSASAIILMHNHPSGESAPSEADVKITKELIRGGQLLKIEVLDHVIVGVGQKSSLRELGYFY